MASVDGEEAGIFSVGQTGGREMGESVGSKWGDVEEPIEGETKMEQDGGGGK